MFTYSFRMKKSTIITVVLSIVVVILTVILIPVGGKAVQTYQANSAPTCKTNEERVEWIKSMGWEIEEQPSSEIQVMIPRQFDEIYSQYAMAQRQQGYRIDKYKGKTATKYCYIATNCEEAKGNAVISILQYKNKIVAADISSVELGGFLKPLKAIETK